MKITVNDREETVAEDSTVADLIEGKGLHPGTVLVEHNGTIVLQGRWGTTFLKDEDRLEILRCVGGG